MNGLELAALYTLQHSLPGDTEDPHGVDHWDETLGGLFHETRAQLVGDVDTPRSTRSELLAGDETVVEPAVQRRRRHAECIGSLLDGDGICVGRLRRWSETRDAPVGADTTDSIGREALPRGGLAPLSVEDPGDYGIRVVSGQTAHQLHRILVGTYRSRS